MTLTPSDLTPRATAPVHTRWRRIATPIPVPESLPLLERLRAAEPVSMWAMPPIVWHQAQGFLVRDPYGNQWIELTSSIVMANAGHGHPRILEAIRRAVESPLLATYAFPSPARLAVLEKLAALSPIPDAKVILFSAGTEASECAIMLMRRHGVNRHPDKIGIVSFGWGFHGRTLGAHLASGIAQPADWVRREQLHHYLIPFPYCLQCPWGRTRYERCGARRSTGAARGNHRRAATGVGDLAHAA
jgi:4-aminobutyrate aminotransferase/(S)-3-amino-2-methylpropionate transaminase